MSLTLKDLLFLETPSDDLHADRQTVHITAIAALVCITLDLVPWLEWQRQFIERAVYARGVVKLQ